MTIQENVFRALVLAETARRTDELLSEGELQQELDELAAELVTRKINLTQVRGLENIAYTTLKVSDIVDYLKRQVGRDQHRINWAANQLGKRLIEALENLRGTAQAIYQQARQAAPAAEEQNGGLLSMRPVTANTIHLELCRAYIRHLSAQYLYKRALQGEEGSQQFGEDDHDDAGW